MTPQTVVLGLGSNLGDSRATLREAIALIRREITQAPTVSNVYESPALLPPDAPEEWDRPYLNLAVAGPCMLSPQALLEACKRIEHALGRKERARWAPREIDVDILAYDTIVMQNPKLAIPHPDLGVRPFALLPFDEVAPGWRHPVEDWTAYERLAALPQANIACLGPL